MCVVEVGARPTGASTGGVGCRAIAGGRTMTISPDLICMRLGNTEHHHGTARTCVPSRPLKRRLCTGKGPKECLFSQGSHHTSLGSQAPRRKLHSHAGYNDLGPDQHGGKILPNFSNVLIVSKWSVMFSRCTTTFHSDGLVN